MRLITLTTDFSEADSYVAEVKARILSYCGLSQIVLDNTHQISPHDILQGAFSIAHIARSCPANTIHLGVVDPGVGTKRARVIAEFKRNDGSFWFIGPDNGLSSQLCIENPDYQFWKAHSLPLNERQATKIIPISGGKEVNSSFQTSSTTFDGRDVFAPLAAYLAKGGDISQLATPLENPLLLDIPTSYYEQGVLCGEILYFDSFGNAATTICQNELDTFSAIVVASSTGISEPIPRCDHFAQLKISAAGCLINSHGRLEIFVNQGSARQQLGLNKKQQVKVILS